MPAGGGPFNHVASNLKAVAAAAAATRSGSSCSPPWNWRSDGSLGRSHPPFPGGHLDQLSFFDLDLVVGNYVVFTSSSARLAPWPSAAWTCGRLVLWSLIPSGSQPPRFS